MVVLWMVCCFPRHLPSCLFLLWISPPEETSHKWRNPGKWGQNARVQYSTVQYGKEGKPRKTRDWAKKPKWESADHCEISRRTLLVYSTTVLFYLSRSAVRLSGDPLNQPEISFFLLPTPSCLPTVMDTSTKPKRKSGGEWANGEATNNSIGRKYFSLHKLPENGY